MLKTFRIRGGVFAILGASFFSLNSFAQSQQGCNQFIGTWFCGDPVLRTVAFERSESGRIGLTHFGQEDAAASSAEDAGHGGSLECVNNRLMLGGQHRGSISHGRLSIRLPVPDQHGSFMNLNCRKVSDQTDNDMAWRKISCPRLSGNYSCEYVYDGDVYSTSEHRYAPILDGYGKFRGYSLQSTDEDGRSNSIPMSTDNSAFRSTLPDGRRGAPVQHYCSNGELHSVYHFTTWTLEAITSVEADGSLLERSSNGGRNICSPVTVGAGSASDSSSTFRDSE